MGYNCLACVYGFCHALVWPLQVVSKPTRTGSGPHRRSDATETHGRGRHENSNLACQGFEKLGPGPGRAARGRLATRMRPRQLGRVGGRGRRRRSQRRPRPSQPDSEPAPWVWARWGAAPSRATTGDAGGAAGHNEENSP